MEKSVAELAALLGAELHGDGAVRVRGVAEPAAAGPGDVALLTAPARLAEGQQSRAGAFVVRRVIPDISAPQLVCTDPGRTLALLLQQFRPGVLAERQAGGVDPRAAVDPGADLHPDAWVGPFAYVGPGARVGAGCRVEPFSYVGARAVLGRRCLLGPGAVVLGGCVLGDDVVLGPGAVVGSRGFGFWRDEAGWHPIPSPGGVVIEDAVEIGANSCVDAGTLAPTRVEAGAKVDNLVQVGHNCTVGQRALLCGQVGLAGSVTVEADCELGGQVGVADHRCLGRGSRVAGQSGVIQDVAPGATVAGYPALPHRRWLRSAVLFARLGDLARQVRDLSDRVARIMER